MYMNKVLLDHSNVIVEISYRYFFLNDVEYPIDDNVLLSSLIDRIFFVTIAALSDNNAAIEFINQMNEMRHRFLSNVHNVWRR